MQTQISSHSRVCILWSLRWLPKGVNKVLKPLHSGSVGTPDSPILRQCFSCTTAGSLISLSVPLSALQQLPFGQRLVVLATFVQSAFIPLFTKDSHMYFVPFLCTTSSCPFPYLLIPSPSATQILPLPLQLNRMTMISLGLSFQCHGWKIIPKQRTE